MQRRRQSKKSGGVQKGEGLSWHSWRAREREPLWGFGGIAPVGSRGKAPGQGVMGAKPPEADNISMFETPTLTVFLTSFRHFWCF